MKYKSPIYCEHANENPSMTHCDCPKDCACRERMCKTKTKFPTYIENELTSRTNYSTMHKTLTLKQYKKALQKAKKEDVESIAMHHIEKSRILLKALRDILALDVENDKLPGKIILITGRIPSMFLQD